MDPPAANRLAHETSPYLLQHAHNPVDWFPWGDEAFSRARQEDKPVFLSVGYAACHWCHVMERESFEDPRTATFLNQRFVSVKVDREERPDVDALYMDAVQAMTGQGGWPMSVWLTPDGQPFYAGTYFPDEPRHGMPSFLQVLHGLSDAWMTRRDEIVAQSGKVTDAIGRAAKLQASAEPLTEGIEEAAVRRLRGDFDPRWGGFGGAPKFPQPMVLGFLLRMAVRGTPDAMEMVIVTLDRMADGGLHDQIGGGFARYSTDAAWHVPHFEKMLYDNAQLAEVYTQGWLTTRSERYRSIATSTLGYLLREMQHPEGGFYSSQDADSEGIEGRFSTWSWDELVGSVGEAVAEAWGATPSGNWAPPESGATNVLWRPVSLGAVGAKHGLAPGELGERLEAAREVLFEMRERRIRPSTDDKILTAWNALAIRAFALAGRAFGEPAFIDAALRAARFVWGSLRDTEGRLLRSWRQDRASTLGFADDHALLAGAFLTLFETTGDTAWFARARELGDALMDRFGDPERGGFFQTATDAEPLMIRPKDPYDNAVPSGNSAAADALLRLALFTGEVRYEDAGVSAIRLVRDALASAPTGFGSALSALDLYVGPTREVVVIGEPDDPGTQVLLRELVSERFLPNIVIATGPSGETPPSDDVPLLEGRRALDGQPTAYVCERFSCQLPVTDPEALVAQLAHR